MKTCSLCGEEFLFLKGNGACPKCNALIRENKLSKEKAVWLRDGKRCRYCGKELSFSSKTIDHFIPKSKGGKNTFDNLVCSCYQCNQKKGGKVLQEKNILFVENNFFRRN